MPGARGSVLRSDSARQSVPGRKLDAGDALPLCPILNRHVASPGRTFDQALLPQVSKELEVRVLTAMRSHRITQDRFKEFLDAL